MQRFEEQGQLRQHLLTPPFHAQITPNTFSASNKICTCRFSDCGTLGRIAGVTIADLSGCGFPTRISIGRPLAVYT